MNTGTTTLSSGLSTFSLNSDRDGDGDGDDDLSVESSASGSSFLSISSTLSAVSANKWSMRHTVISKQLRHPLLSDADLEHSFDASSADKDFLSNTNTHTRETVLPVLQPRESSVRPNDPIPSPMRSNTSTSSTGVPSLPPLVALGLFPVRRASIGSSHGKDREEERTITIHGDASYMMTEPHSQSFRSSRIRPRTLQHSFVGDTQQCSFLHNTFGGTGKIDARLGSGQQKRYS